MPPSHTDRAGTGGARHLDVVYRVAHNHGVARRHSRLSHRCQHHAGMRFGGRIVGSLDRDEALAQTMTAEHGAHAALRLAGRDAEQRIRPPAERIERRARPGIERLEVLVGLPQCREGALVTCHQTIHRMLFAAPEKPGKPTKRIRERKADDRQELFTRWNRQSMRLIGLLHCSTNHMLAVHQRSVAIENDQFQ